MTVDLAETIKVISQIAGWGVGIGALIVALRTNKKITKSKAEDEDIRASAAQKIVDAASAQVDLINAEADKAREHLRTERVESDKWKTTCNMLEGKVSLLSKRVSENETFQSNKFYLTLYPWEIDLLSHAFLRLQKSTLFLNTSLRC